MHRGQQRLQTNFYCGVNTKVDPVIVTINSQAK